MKPVKIPKKLQPILWSVDTDKLDIQKHKGYIIHQVLRFGTLSDIKWLFQTYTKDKIRKFFLAHPSKNYAPEDFHFIKNYVLGLRERLDSDKYVTSISGPIRPRQARGF